MLLYLKDYEIICFNDIIDKEDAKQYADGISCVWVDDLQINPPAVGDNQKFKMYFDGVNVDYVVTDIVEDVDETEKINGLIKETYTTSKAAASDNMVNMDMLLELDEKINIILDHLGLND